MCKKLPPSNIAFECLRDYEKCILNKKFLCVCVCVYVLSQTPVPHFAFQNVLIVIFRDLILRRTLEKYSMFCLFAILYKTIFKNSCNSEEFIVKSIL